jgi:hypothetical protein
VFNDKTVYELKSICMMYDVEYPKTAKKADIIKLIEKAGITEEKYSKDLEDAFGIKEAEKVVKEIKVIEKEPAENITQDKVVLKMVYPRGALNVGNGIIFTIDEPFKMFSRSVADNILSRAKDEVREATPEEVATFYGVNV